MNNPKKSLHSKRKSANYNMLDELMEAESRFKSPSLYNRKSN